MEDIFVIQSNRIALLKEKIPDIDKKFKVKVNIQNNQEGQEDDENRWVRITGKDQDNLQSAKNYTIALCSPEITERINFPNFPVCIFKAFKEKCKENVEISCEIVLQVKEDQWIFLQGSNYGVTLATSKISHLARLLKDKNKVKNIREAKRFDRLVDNFDENEKLKEFPNSLKKEILEMLGMNSITVVDSDSSMDENDIIEVSDDTSAPALGTTDSLASSEESIPSIPIVSKNSSIIVISDESGSEYLSEDEEKPVPNGQVQPDGIDFDMAYLLPPTFAITEWLKVHYQGTSDPQNYVSKRDMLEHFQSHFNIKDHPQLANEFFDRLAVTVFKSDPSYRCVRTKKCKSKHSRRRLVCLKRKTVSGDHGETSGTAVKRQSPPKRSDTMVDWNANKKKENVQPANPGVAVVQPLNLPGHVNLPRPPIHPPPPLNPPSNSLTSWLGSHEHRLPLPVVQATPHIIPLAQNVVTVPMQPQPIVSIPPNPVQRPPPPVNNPYRSLALKVSQMSNEELLSQKRPKINPRLRPIVIDGSNVAMSHGSGKSYSCRGIALCVRFFMERGHGQITCFVPNYRKGGGGTPPSSDAHILIRLEDLGVLKCTPSRRIRGENIVCYDDRFIVELAAANNGVILSNDQYRDLMLQNTDWRKIIEERLLQYTMVGDLLMLPQDPHGRRGPSLEEFLILQDSSRVGRSNPPLLPMPAPVFNPRQDPPAGASLFPSPAPFRPPPSRWAPPRPNGHPAAKHNGYPALSPDEEDQLVKKMLDIFPDRQHDIRQIIRAHPLEKDVGRLMNYFLTRYEGN